MKILTLILFILTLQPAFAQRLPNSSIGTAVGLCSLASKQYLAGRDEESLALYQKAILKSEVDYGKNSRAVSALNYELAVRALALSKFDLAEHCFKKSIEINPNCEAARLMLIQLLRFRNKNNEAYYHTEQSLKKHSQSIALHRDLILCLQENNPASATQQAFVINCLQNDNLDKIPKSRFQVIEKPVNTNTSNAHPVKSATTAKERPDSASAPPKGKKSGKSIKAANTTKTNSAPKNTNANNSINTAAPNPDLAVLQPVDTTAHKVIAKVARPHKNTKTSGGASKRAPIGLVPPPPPPATLGFPSPRASAPATLTELKAKPASLKPEKAASSASKESKESSGEDSDFLLDWASVKKKHPKSN